VNEHVAIREPHQHITFVTLDCD